jgi:hypothetical protein
MHDMTNTRPVGRPQARATVVGGKEFVRLCRHPAEAALLAVDLVKGRVIPERLTAHQALQLTGANAFDFWKAFDLTPQERASIIFNGESLDDVHARRHKPVGISID